MLYTYPRSDRYRSGFWKEMKITRITIRTKVFITTQVGSRKRTRLPSSRMPWIASKLMISWVLSSFRWRITAMAAKFR